MNCQVSDRIGRTRVVGINVLGALIMDFAFIAVALFSKLLPGGYWFVLIGPIFEGLVGGAYCSRFQRIFSDIQA